MYSTLVGKMAQIPLPSAAAQLISELAVPVLTPYELAAHLSELIRVGEYKGTRVKTRLSRLTKKKYNGLVDALITIGVIKAKGFSHYAKYFKTPLYKSTTHEEIVCILDRFCYLSHLSAMFFYGLTIRIPDSIFITTKANQDWKSSALKVMKSELGDAFEDFEAEKLPRMTMQHIEKIRSRVINTYVTKRYGEFRILHDKKFRIATIGQTFLDMLREPNLCGGIYHVIEVYRSYAKQYAKAIIDEIDVSGSAVDKVRAGYLLDEVCGISNGKVDSWLMFAQRGGSRKLDPGSDYYHVYSEKWKLSLNVEGVFDYDD